MSLVAGSMFAGVGGFDLGAQRAGMKVLWAVEKDEKARELLRARFPETEVLEDVTKIDPGGLRRVDVLTAGWPCQDLSVAGNRAGLAGERSGLWREVVRWLAVLRPTWFVGENVTGLLSSAGGRDMGTVLDDLEGLGYAVDCDILDAQFFGVAQRRRRVIFVCQRAEDLLRRPTATSSLITCQLLTEISLGILAVARQPWPTESGNWTCQESWPSVDGLRRRIRLFELGDRNAGGWLRLQQNLDAATARSQPGLDTWDLRDGGSCGLPIKAATSSGVDTEAQTGGGTSSLSTDPSWKECLDALYEGARASTTSTVTSSITEQTIYSCAQALLPIVRLICPSNGSSPSFWSAATSASIAMEGFTSYARSTTSDLFGDPRWVQPWLDWLRQAERASVALGGTGDWTRPGALLPQPEGREWHPASRREAGQEIAGTLGASPLGGGWASDTDRMTFVPEVAPMLGGGNYGAGNLAEGVPMMVAATLSAGAHPGSKLPGRHREDDVNVVVAPTLRSASDSPAAHGKVNGTDQAALVVARPLTAHPNGSRLDGESDQFVVAHPLTSEGADASEDGTGRGTPLVAGVLAPTLRGFGHGWQGQHNDDAARMQMVRRLTPLECERLQGFADGWTAGFSDSTRYRMLGNAICVNVAEWVLKHIARAEP